VGASVRARAWQEGVREFLRIYYGMVRLLDDQVGRVLRALDETGRADETVVVFAATTATWPVTRHGLEEHRCLLHDVARVPLIIRSPARSAAALPCAGQPHGPHADAVVSGRACAACRASRA